MIELKKINFLFRDNELVKIDRKCKYRKKYSIMKFDIYKDDFEYEFKLSDTAEKDLYRGYASLLLDDNLRIDANRSVYLQIISSHLEFQDVHTERESKVVYTINMFVTY